VVSGPRQLAALEDVVQLRGQRGGPAIVDAGQLQDVAAQVEFESKIKANLKAVDHILGSSA
jgi:hypothetical protein